MAVTEMEQAMACPHCGQGGFRSEAELQTHIVKYHEPGEPGTEVDRKPIPIMERNAFRNWLRDKYGPWLEAAVQDYTDNPYYLEWVDLGKPKVSPSEVPPSEEPAPPVTEETPWGDEDTFLADYGGGLETGDSLARYPDEPPREGYHWEYDSSIYRWIEVPNEGLTPWQIEQIRLTEEQAAWDRQQKADTGEMTEWQQWQTEYLPWELEQEQEQERWRLEQQFAEGQQDYELQKWSLEQQFNQAQQELDADLAYQEWQMGYIPHEAQQEYKLNKWKLEQEFAFQREQLDLQQAQLQQEQANYLADLAAHPRSFMEYPLAAGVPQVVQPWMMPLESQQYPELGGFQVGQPIPGWPTDWSGMEAYAPPIYSPADITPAQTTPAPGYTPFAPPTPTGMQLQQAPKLPVTPGQPPIRNGHGTGGIPPSMDLSHLTGQTMPSMPTEPTTPAYLTPEQLRVLGLDIARQKASKPGRIVGPSPIEQGRTSPEWGAIGYGLGYREDMPFPMPSNVSRAYQQGAISLGEAERSTREYIDWQTAKMAGEEDVLPRTALTYLPQEPEPERTFPTGFSAAGRGRIPSMQYGGWVTKPTTVNIAEKEPELVTPLSQLWNSKPSSTPTQYGATTTYPTAPTTPSTGGGYPGISDPYYPLGGLPNLTRPSRQYQARMGPTAWNQYAAYMQATSAITPEELEWRLWNLAPPGGQHRGLSYAR